MTASATPGSKSNRGRHRASVPKPDARISRLQRNRPNHDFLHRPADREGHRRPSRDRRPQLLPDPAGAGRSGAGDGGRSRRQAIRFSWRSCARNSVSTSRCRCSCFSMSKASSASISASRFASRCRSRTLILRAPAGDAAADRDRICDFARASASCSARLAARFAGTWADTAITVLALIFYATPLFWVALMAILLFSVAMDWLPSFGYETVGANYTGLAHVLDVAAHLSCRRRPSACSSWPPMPA